MRLWAFATSPHGLGLAEGRFWRLTYRELHALMRPYRESLMRWAIEQAMFANANRDPKKTEAWHPADFLPWGNREARLAKEHAGRDIALLDQWGQRIKMQKGAEPQEVGIPDWAIGEYKGKA